MTAHSSRLALGALLFIALAHTAIGAEGEATLGIDQRNRTCPENFGFAFVEGVNSGYDTCKTLDKDGNSTLKAIDGVASPQNSEPIFHSIAGDTVTFDGRTADCYYMVTGVHTGSGPGRGGNSPWNADFDTKLSQAHFVAYINQRYNSDDDYFGVDAISIVYIEVANPTSTNTVHFKLSQQRLSDSAEVQIMQDNGVDPEPIGQDGKTVRVYDIQPDPQASGPTYPNGTPVAVKVKGVSQGLVSIIATETN